MLMNIYAPTGAAERKEHFCNTDVAHLIRDAPANILLGEISIVLDPADATWHYNYSRALAALVQGFGMRDVWQQHQAERVYTHYTPAGATRIDRFYTSNALFHKKIAAEIVVGCYHRSSRGGVEIGSRVPTFRRRTGIWNMKHLPSHRCST
jgi:hypothetical protein